MPNKPNTLGKQMALWESDDRPWQDHRTDCDEQELSRCLARGVGWEPDALTGHFGSERVLECNATRKQYWDTKRRKPWTTGKTNRILNREAPITTRPASPTVSNLLTNHPRRPR